MATKINKTSGVPVLRSRLLNTKRANCENDLINTKIPCHKSMSKRTAFVNISNKEGISQKDRLKTKGSNSHKNPTLKSKTCDNFKKSSKFFGFKLKSTNDSKRQALGDLSNNEKLNPEKTISIFKKLSIKRISTPSANVPSTTTSPPVDVDVLEMPDYDSDSDTSMKSADTVKTLLPADVVDVDTMDDNDPMYSSHYAYNIFEYLKSREAKFKVGDYMKWQNGVSTNMRMVLVDWMVEVQENFELNHETLYMSVKLVDLYLQNTKNIKTHVLQLIGASALLISSKFDERCPPAIDDYVYICDDAFKRNDLTVMEIEMLTIIGFDIGVPVSYRFLRRYAKCGDVDVKTLYLARFVLESSLLNYKFVGESESKMAAASLLLSTRMMNVSIWNPTMVHYSGRTESDLEDLLLMLNKNLRYCANKNKNVNSKYSHDVFLNVASIPLLPL